MGYVEIAGGQSGQVQLLAAAGFDFPLTEHETAGIKVSGPGFAYAPVAEGADAGVAFVCINGETVGKLPLVFGETVEQKTEEKSFFEKLLGRE